MADILYRYKDQVYFNITNKCCCNCTFCIRNHQDYYGEAGNLWFEKEPLPDEIIHAVDRISISLNMPDAKAYTDVVRPAFGGKSFEAMLRFAQDCKKYLSSVRFSVVDVIGKEKIEESQMLADSLGIPLYIRVYS